VLEQAHRGRRLDVLREHDDAEIGVALAERQRGLHPLIGERGRHPDVDQCHVSAERAGAANEVFGVVGLRDHVESLLAENPDEPLAKQQRVIRDDQPHRAAYAA
jgi:hypothetical protein